MTAVCHHRTTTVLDPDSPFPQEIETGDICGKPATHYSCNVWPREVCAEHKCRCPQPGQKRSREPFPDAVNAADAIITAQHVLAAKIADAEQDYADEVDRIRRLCPHTHKGERMVDRFGGCQLCGGNL